METERDAGRGMRDAIPIGYAEHDAPADLASHVLCFWTRLEDAGAPQSRVHRVVPDGCVDIVVEVGRATGSEVLDVYAVGAMTTALVVEGVGPRLFIGVRFRPGSAMAALGVPAAELTDDRVALDALIENSESELAALQSAESNEARFAAVVELVRRRLRGSAAVPRSVRAAVHRILGARGDLRIAALASDVGITRQQLAKQFAAHVGVAPKMLARIARTQAALARADAARASYPRNVDWSAIAYELGYYDQPHFIDEFREITGRTPTEWAKER
jgi:AraC-like DNA-binding protein